MARKPPVEDPREEALHRAQMLYYDASEANTAKQRIAIAKKALAISPLCADAYVLLAEHSEHGSDAAFDLWKRAVEAGKEALGADFEEFAGEFWGFIETRPYMRARFGLAFAHWLRGERDEAIGHLRAMLELNPGDNQGVRYILAGWLIEAGRDDDLHALLKQYADEGSATWLWTAALAAFRRDGDTPASRGLLAEAIKGNVYIAPFLLAERALPKKTSPFISMGGADEAQYYVEEFGKGWKQTPGAMEWLTAGRPAEKTSSPKTTGGKTTGAKTSSAKASSSKTSGSKASPGKGRAPAGKPKGDLLSGK